jgi:HrpA-like RNA helicase
MQNVLDKLQDLPVNTLLDALIRHTDKGSVAIVNSETASGKTLLVPTMLQLITDEQVLVIEPRRFLAVNAAETLALLSETDLGSDVGYVVGHRGSVSRQEAQSHYDPENNKILFMTYGYALATMAILQADIIVLDEIHESSIDIAICKALIKLRMKTDRPLKRLVLMSATLDVDAELDYWNDFNPKVFSAETGRKFTCDRRYEPAAKECEAAVNLVRQGSRGVLVFMPGVAEIGETVVNITKILATEGLTDLIEVASVHGQSDMDERTAAFAAPTPMMAKILVGTDVLESGMNLPWVSAGVSGGLRKEPTVSRESGAINLQAVPLAQSNLDQRIGRTNRFCDSVFILCGQIAYTDMKSMPTPEIVRLPLTSLYMQCMSIEVDPRTLEFLPQPDPRKLQDAERTLQRLGFLNGRSLTEDGMFAQNLPVGLETAAMLCHANKLGILADALILAAVFENGGVRKDATFPHGFDNTSDLFDSAIAFASGFTFQRMERSQRNDNMDDANIHRRRFNDTMEILTTMEHVFRCEANFSKYLPRNRSDQTDLFVKLRQCILAGMINNLGHWDPAGRGSITMNGDYLTSYRHGNNTGVTIPYGPIPISAKLRQITPRERGAPFTIAETITCFETSDFEAFHCIRPEVFRFESDAHFNTILAFNKPIFLERRTWAGNRQSLGDGDSYRFQTPRSLSEERGVSLVDILASAADAYRETHNTVRHDDYPRDVQVVTRPKPVSPPAKIRQPERILASRDELHALAARFKK